MVDGWRFRAGRKRDERIGLRRRPLTSDQQAVIAPLDSFLLAMMAGAGGLRTRGFVIVSQTAARALSVGQDREKSEKNDRSHHFFEANTNVCSDALWENKSLDFDQGLVRQADHRGALMHGAELMAAERRATAAENRERDRRMNDVMEAIARSLPIREIHERRIGLEN